MRRRSVVAETDRQSEDEEEDSDREGHRFDPFDEEKEEEANQSYDDAWISDAEVN